MARVSPELDSVAVQLMVPKESIVESLQEQGYSVPELEQQLQTIGCSVVGAASMKVGTCSSLSVVLIQSPETF